MRKALISVFAAGFSVLALTATSFATGNGVVGGAVRGAENIAEGVVEGAGDVVEGAGNTAEDILTPGDNNPAVDDTANDNVTRTAVREEAFADTAGSTANPATGVSAFPFVMTVGGVGAAAIAALSGRRK